MSVLDDWSKQDLEEVVEGFHKQGLTQINLESLLDWDSAGEVEHFDSLLSAYQFYYDDNESCANALDMLVSMNPSELIDYNTILDYLMDDMFFLKWKDGTVLYIQP